MKKRYRIKKNSEIDAVFKHKKSRSDGYFTIYHIEENALDHFRFALSIGKKYGNAVKRNLAKRQIRMIIHSIQKDIKNKDFVIVIKPNAATLSFLEIKQKLLSLFKKTNITERTDE